MSDQITETQATTEETGYPSKDNPKEIVPWLNDKARTMDFYEQTAKAAREDADDIQKKLPETTVSFLTWGLIKSLFFAALLSAVIMGALLITLVQSYKPEYKDLFIFSIYENHWPELWIALFVVIYLFRAYGKIKQRKKTKAYIGAKQQEIANCVSTLTSDECKSFYNYIIPFMGPSYCYSAAANYFVRLFLDGRCTNLQDCKNLYEQDKHAAEQKQQFQTLCHEMAETKYLAGAAMSRANSALAASAFATATALSASSRASAAESSLEDIKRSL